MSYTSLVFPPSLYPAFAPLSAPMANHLLLQEARQYRHRPLKRPEDQEIAQIVLERIRRARTIVFEYMHPFVLADKKRQQRDESRAFPDPDWLLDALAQYTPDQKKNDISVLDYWQKKGLLRREKTRGLLDITSVAALLIARLTEGNRQRNWLPSALSESEPRWWCYGRSAPGASIQAVSVPLSETLPAPLVVWTPWQGAIWEEQWRILGDLSYRWAGVPLLPDLRIWNQVIPDKIEAIQHDPFFARTAIQTVLLQEARKATLDLIVTKSVMSLRTERSMKIG